MKPRFKDGLWRIECGSFTAGFIVSNGHITRMAPCLWRAFDLFKPHAVWIAP